MPLLVLAMASSIASASLLRAPVPIHQENWIVSSDYPYAMLEGVSKAEGETYVDLSIGLDGRVISCSPTSAKSLQRLAAAACQLISHRGRFVPARDSAGAPVVGTYRNMINWVLSRRSYHVRVPDFVIQLRRFPNSINLRTRVAAVVEVDETGRIVACDLGQYTTEPVSVPAASAPEKLLPEKLKSILCQQLKANWQPPDVRDAGGVRTRYVRAVEIGFEESQPTSPSPRIDTPPPRT